MNHHAKFFLASVGLIACNSLAISAINAFVDPYNVVGSQLHNKVNELKPELNKDPRQFKAIKIMRIKPKTIFLGNSRADIGLDPSHPALASYPPAYNLAIPAGDMYTSMRYFQHALANQPDLKRVVIGIDLVAFEHRDNIEKVEPNQAKVLGDTNHVEHLPSLLFSTDALSSSFSTIWSNIVEKSEKHYYLVSGRLVRTKPVDMPLPEFFRLHLKIAYFDHWYKNYQLSQKQLDALRTIVKTCKEKGIDLKVFISPAHATQWEAVYAKELWPTWEDWKREVVKITPVWDFSGYNSITSEPLSDKMNNYLESSHYVKEIGDLALNRMFNYQLDKVPDDFGVLLTSSNVEPHLAQIRNQRKQWIKKNPKTVQLVQRWSEE